MGGTVFRRVSRMRICDEHKEGGKGRCSDKSLGIKGRQV